MSLILNSLTLAGLPMHYEPVAPSSFWGAEPSSLAALEEGTLASAPSDQALGIERCPITLQTAQELGGDVYTSASENGRLYSRSGLRMWLLVDSQERANNGLAPVFRSPVSRRDMKRDAKTLAVPLPLRLRGTGPRGPLNMLVGDGAALVGFFAVSTPIVLIIAGEVQSGHAQLPVAVVLGALLTLSAGGLTGLACEGAALVGLYALRMRQARAALA